jgi:uncharacterized protein DUF6790
MSTLIAEHNNCDPRDVEYRFHAESREIFWISGAIGLSGSQHQIQKQRGHDERNGARIRITNALHKFVTNIISFGDMNGSKLYLFLFFLIGNYFLTLLIIGLVAGLISLLSKPRPLRTSTVAEAFLSHYMLFPIGISNLINFVFHVFFGDTAAKFIGWDNSPFQAEVGFASLGIGIAGVIAFNASLPFRFATLIPPAVFSLGAAGGHIYQMIAAHNFSPGNVGLVLPSDILIPVVGFVLLWLSYKHPKSGASDHKLT